MSISTHLAYGDKPMTEAAVIDRVVHHPVILKLNISSYRLEESKKKNEKSKQTALHHSSRREVESTNQR